jgi:hypothetical protein
MKVEQVVPIRNVSDVTESVVWLGKLGWDRGLEVTHPPTDEPWHVRDFHVRHPDGHVLRIGRAA